MNKDFHDFLIRLGFLKKDLEKNLTGNIYYHEIADNSSVSIKYIYTPTKEDIFEQHQLLWNRNTEPVFIAVSKNKTHLINSQAKPDKENPLKNSICIKSFDYGTNAKGFENVDIELISKEYVNSAYFFDYISKNQRKGQTVDKDLLLNLLALKNDLIKESNRKIVYLLILRCLFLKYLEDRGIFEDDYLVKILEQRDANELKSAFDEIAKINGDVFKFDQFEIADIKAEYLDKLALFFKSDYITSQKEVSQLKLLFPYRFDQIPIQLISHVYEAFLKGSAKKGKGIYYTPSFLVNFMLAQSFPQKLKKNPALKILDPAVGSGAFLVEIFKMIQQAQGDKLDFDAKKEILENQLFGIDIDSGALQIAAFSLYLALLETEDPSFIKDEIKRANPILPSLIGKTLIHGNTIFENMFPDTEFDFIVSNPPWGSIPTDANEDNIKERDAVDNKQGEYQEYEYVADYERSQAFLTRVERWCKNDTLLVMVVKNSIFLNDKTRNFRVDLLIRYHVDTFYELSHYNKILFKKSVIGEIEGEKIELGASEPCVVLIFSPKSEKDNITKYISPKLTPFSEYFNIIHYASRDSFELNQSEFIEADSLWKVLVHGDVETHDLIVNKLQCQNELAIEARRGFQPKTSMASSMQTNWKTIIEPSDFQQFYQKSKTLGQFDWNQNLRRRPEKSTFNDKRIVIPIGPTKDDHYLLRGLFLEDEIVFKDNMISVKFRNRSGYINNYLPYLGIFNSKLIGFIIFQLSVQWGKGKTWVNLRNVDLEQLPIKEISNLQAQEQITELVRTIQKKKAINQECDFEIDQLNEIVFNLYGLLDYEKEIIKEFYDIRVKRQGLNQSLVRKDDIQRYFEAFKDSFSLILSNENSLNATYRISSNLGTVMCFSIANNSESKDLQQSPNLEILNFAKSRQLHQSDSLKILFEEKVKIYDQDKFYIIKSNQFKDWTVRQAMKDAKEEIELFVNQLSPING